MDVFPFNADVLFLPFKLKANTTQEIKKQLKNCCFYLSIKEHKMFLC